MGVWSGTVGGIGNRRIQREWKLWQRVVREKASKKALKFKLVKRQVFFHFCFPSYLIIVYGMCLLRIVYGLSATATLGTGSLFITYWDDGL